jgi:Rps23 Pro-64 3,4-dihydroxylase Tpa1-like proline 4-hydroxylase
MLSIFNIKAEQYTSKEPFPFFYQDSFLPIDLANSIQEEILNLPDSAWDRYNNPFEQKYTLRDKYSFPPLTNKLFEELQSEEFIHHLSEICGYKLTIDPTRNFWGIHKYRNGDRLDIHVDAGLHPVTKQKKQLTFGLYLSYNWKESYGCHLEVWRGTNANKEPKLLNKVYSICPQFNRAIIFTNNDYSWHGNPTPASGEDDSKRIFITISYLSNNISDENKRTKALFIKHPDEEQDNEKDRLRLLRADPEQYKYIYRV